MESLNSERLVLIPLDASRLELAIQDYDEMQTSLGLRKSAAELSEEMKYAMEIRLKRVMENKENFMWYTNWAIVDKNEMNIVGFIMIKGQASMTGEVIIGYGIDEPYRRNGFASEAVRSISSWIFNDPNAKSIVADTEKDNTSSHRVMTNNGASIYKTEGDLIWWKIDNYKIFHS